MPGSMEHASIDLRTILDVVRVLLSSQEALAQLLPLRYIYR